MGCGASSSCDSCNCRDILKRIIITSAEREKKEIVYVFLQFLSLITLVVCIPLDHWLSGNSGYQGLWNFCYKNGTSMCCGDLFDAVGSQGKYCRL